MTRRRRTFLFLLLRIGLASCDRSLLHLHRLDVGAVARASPLVKDEAASSSPYSSSSARSLEEAAGAERKRLLADPQHLQKQQWRRALKHDQPPKKHHEKHPHDVEGARDGGNDNKKRDREGDGNVGEEGGNGNPKGVGESGGNGGREGGGGDETKRAGELNGTGSGEGEPTDGGGGSDTKSQDPADAGASGDASSGDGGPPEGEDDDPCRSAISCADCASREAADDDSKLCWWDGTACQTTDANEHELDIDTMCDGAKPLGEGGDASSPTPPPSLNQPATKGDGEGAGPPSSATAAPSPSPVAKPAEVAAKPAPSPAPVQATPKPSVTPTKAPVEVPKHVETPEPSMRKATLPPTPFPTIKKAPPPAPELRPAPPPAPTKAPSATDADDTEAGGGSGWAVFAGLGLLLGAVVGLRRRRSTLGGAGGIGPGPFGPRSPAHVPYQGVSTTDDEDDWGWDDEPQTVGDVELAVSKKLEDESPSRPVARKGLSLAGSGGAGRLQATGSRVKTPPHQKKRLTHRSAGLRDDAVSHMLVPNVGGSSSSAVATPSSSAAASPVVHRTTAGSVSPAPVPVAPVLPPRRPDDIFAEMGFAAQPTFSKPSTGTSASRATASAPSVPRAPLSGGSSPWLQTATSRTAAAAVAPRPLPSAAAAPAPPARPSAAAAADLLDDDLAAASGGDPHWDDDADLDDLLND